MFHIKMFSVPVHAKQYYLTLLAMDNLDVKSTWQLLPTIKEKKQHLVWFHIFLMWKK